MTTTAGRAEPRFDMDGDGRDELVVAGVEKDAGFAIRVRYSGLSRWKTLRAPTSPEPGRRLTFPYTAGDFNGDGYQDLAVSSLRMISQGVFEHGVYVYSGGANGLNGSNPAYLPDLHAEKLAAGDLNRDGRDDLVLTEGGVHDDDGPFRGSVTVLTGTTNGLAASSARQIHQVVPRWPGLAEEHFGTYVVVGDYTGDGYDDLVVAGMRRGTNESDFHGMLTLFPGSAGGPDTTAVTKIEGQLDIYGSFPVDLMVMSDMNRDGREDLILGLPRYADGQIYYLPGNAAGLTTAGHRVIHENTPGVPGAPDDDPDGSHFGYSLATGDATGDGIPDLLVGAVTKNVGKVSGAGAVYLIPGTPQGPTGVGSLRYTQGDAASTWDRRISEPAETHDQLGSSVALLDLDGTGPFEILTEAKSEDIGQSEAGAYGLITTLQLRQSPPRRGSTQPGPAALVAVKLQRPADFSDSTFTMARLGYGLLAA